MNILAKKLITIILIVAITVLPHAISKVYVHAQESQNTQTETTPQPTQNQSQETVQTSTGSTEQHVQNIAPIATPQTPATPRPPQTPRPTKTPVPTKAPQNGNDNTTPTSATPKPPATPKAPQTPRPAQTAQPSVQDEAPEQTATAYTPPANSVTTGGQSVDSQVGNSTVITGDANVNGTIINSANTNITGLQTNASGSNTASNTKNGAETNNHAQTNTMTSSDQTLANVADITNGVHIGAITGSNSASRNTGNGEIITGDANIGLTVINGANNNMSGLAVNQYDVNGNQTGDIVLGTAIPTAACGGAYGVCANGVLGSAKNEANGVNSQNNGISNTTTSDVINMANSAEVTNDILIDVITGRNKADSNVGTGAIETGDANIGLTVLNFLNNNIIAATIDIINIFGEYIGNIILPAEQQNTGGVNNTQNNSATNAQNGDSSKNTATTNIINTQQTTQANLADIQNNLNINANTGANTTNSNTNGHNTIQTGDTKVNANIYNVANVNATDGGYIVLINDNGVWRGIIYGAQGNTAGSQGIHFTVEPDGTIVASNQGNGADSTNNASNNTTNEKTVAQTNNGKLENNITIHADTGNNSASRNTGGGTIKTGNVNVAASIMNFVNNNFIGQTFRVVLINVVGKWTGNVLPAWGASQPQHAVGGTQTTIANQEKQHNEQTPSANNNQEQNISATETQINENQKKQVLGKMVHNTYNPLSKKKSASIILDNGQKFYIDDTLGMPVEKPIVASSVDVKTPPVKQANYWLYLLAVLPVLIGATGIAVLRRRISKQTNIPVQ